MDPKDHVSVPYQKVKAAGEQLNTQSESDSWLLVWLGIVGVCYALAQAEPLLGTKPDPRLKHKQALGVLAALNKSSPADDAGTANWMCGFHLNSAEIRIQSVFHRLLKTFCDREAETVYADELVRDILQTCPKCGVVRVTDRHALDVLEGFREDVVAGPGSALRSVWKRANAFKHRPEHRPDQEDPTLRWKAIVEALNDLLAVYFAFARTRPSNTAT